MDQNTVYKSDIYSNLEKQVNYYTKGSLTFDLKCYQLVFQEALLNKAIGWGLLGNSSEIEELKKLLKLLKKQEDNYSLTLQLYSQYNSGFGPLKNVNSLVILNKAKTVIY